MRTPLRIWLLAIVLAAWGAAYLAGLDGIASAPAYLYATSALLAIGLFGSTAGIDRQQARQDRRLILLAVTVGVLLKAAIIGGVLYLASRDPVYLVFGVAVAQIDPLSVAALMSSDRMSPRAKAILASWASFDDPVTVLLVVYAAWIASGTGAGSALGGYGLNLVLNLALAAVAYAAWRWLRRWPVVLAVVLLGLAGLAVWQFLMLGVAIAGLFVRPQWLERFLPRVTNVALLVSGALLGLLLVGGVNPGWGAALGLMAFVAQIIAGTLLTRGLPRTDRVHLALAQQNGITAIILALRLETDYPGAAAVIAPAILVTNVLHYLANLAADRRSLRSPRSPRDQGKFHRIGDPKQ